jgi:hypothetical protein
MLLQLRGAGGRAYATVWRAGFYFTELSVTSWAIGGHTNTF